MISTSWNRSSASSLLPGLTTLTHLPRLTLLSGLAALALLARPALAALLTLLAPHGFVHQLLLLTGKVLRLLQALHHLLHALHILIDHAGVRKLLQHPVDLGERFLGRVAGAGFIEFADTVQHAHQVLPTHNLGVAILLLRLGLVVLLRAGQRLHHPVDSLL